MQIRFLLRTQTISGFNLIVTCFGLWERIGRLESVQSDLKTSITNSVMPTLQAHTALKKVLGGKEPTHQVLSTVLYELEHLKRNDPGEDTSSEERESKAESSQVFAWATEILIKEILLKWIGR